MYIDSVVDPYLVLEDAPLRDALRKMTDNRHGLVFVVDEHGEARGCMTDGDFRRWLVAAPAEVDLGAPVARAMNRDIVSARRAAPRDAVAALFSERLTAIPLLDDRRRIVAVALRHRPPLRIGRFHIGRDEPAFIIAEIGNNHGGDEASARHLIDLAAKAGADAVKFQLRDLDSLYRNAGRADDPAEDLGSQYVLDQLARFQLTPAGMGRVFAHARARGILPLCTPWDAASIAVLEGLGVEAYKAASPDLTNHDLLRAMAATGKPILLSTGMSSEAEIGEAVDLLGGLGASFILLHCNSAYPPPFKDLNLRFMARLEELSNGVVGYSGHERGWHVPVAAVAMGARVIEKHFTDDRTKEGNDHRISLLPDEFAAMVAAIRQVEEALGDGIRRISQGEFMNREILGKSLVAARDIAAGEMLAAGDVLVRGPGRGLAPNKKALLIGQVARRPIARLDFFYPSDLGDTATTLRPYRFRRPWGLPVRYHDHAELAARSNPDLLEFHLSFKDMEVDPAVAVTGRFDMGLVVHAPEVFAGDFLIDLASDDAAIRRRSIAELQRVVDITRGLKPAFLKAARPPVVVNVGGFSRDWFVDGPERARRYDRLEGALAEVDAAGVEILPQTMPPFPWLFGGQRYHNLFLGAADIVAFCRCSGLRVCLDVSHSKLTCTHFGWSFSEFVAAVAPCTAHLHLVDAAGLDREGLQIGDGEIDFAALGRQLDALAPAASFIPEIWQGHKDNGHGFAVALERLERWF